MMNTINCDKEIKMTQFNIPEEQERAQIWQNEGGSQNTGECELWLQQHKDRKPRHQNPVPAQAQIGGQIHHNRT